MTTISAGKRGGRSRRGALASDLCELTWLCTYRSTRRRQPVSALQLSRGAVRRVDLEFYEPVVSSHADRIAARSLR
jgi:hypothetical protein